MKVLENKLEVLENSHISERLVKWGEENFRNFPWRFTFDPFKVAISEMLLRRTRALQVVAPYNRITAKYSDMCKIAVADRNCLRDLIISLGICGRVELILKAANFICENYNGTITSDRDELTKVPGFGDYTISAIRVFGFSERDPLIDANTVKILGRLLGIKNNDSLRRTNFIHDAYRSILQNANPVKFGYAILDLGAMVCTKSPKCQICPIYRYCTYYKNVKIRE